MHPDDPQPDGVQRHPGTPPRAEDVSRAAASRLVAACEAAWRALQRDHPEIPDAVIVLGTGMERGRLVKLGHWWGGQWVVGEGRQAEVLLAGEALHLSAEAVFEVLAHEAAHGINAARGVKDTSRGGRYHNAFFKEAAEKIGLTVNRMKPHGWADTTLGSDARGRYAEVISTIAAEMRLARHVTRIANRQCIETEAGEGDPQTGAERNGSRTERSSGRPIPAGCGCGRRLRMAPSVLAAAPVICGSCGLEFAASRIAEIATERRPEEARTATQARTPEHADASKPTLDTTPEPARPAAAVVDDSFLERRRQALEADAGRSGPYAEGLQHVEDFEAALVEMCRRENDPEARRTLEAFRERRADILDWLAEATTAEVVPFPQKTSASRPHAEVEGSIETELDLCTIELPLRDLDPLSPAEVIRRREPPTPELGA